MFTQVTVVSITRDVGGAGKGGGGVRLPLYMGCLGMCDKDTQLLSHFAQKLGRDFDVPVRDWVSFLTKTVCAT